MAAAVSVIVPAFNAAGYLEDCVASILAGTFGDFELLLIDDGSTDATASLCDRLGREDPRIRVFHTPNRGLPSARNLGLEHARGTYIAFADADDLVGKTMLQRMYAAMENGDLAMCRFLRCSREKADFTGECGEPVAVTPARAAKEMLASYGPYVWNRLYKTRILTENNIRFRPEAQGAEDLYFNAAYLACCRNAVLLDGALYAYISTEGSITNRFRSCRTVEDRYMSLPGASRYAADTLADLSPEVSREYRARAAMYYQTVLRKLRKPSEAYLTEALDYVEKHKEDLLPHIWGWKYYCSALVLCADYRVWAKLFRRGLDQ